MRRRRSSMEGASVRKERKKAAAAKTVVIKKEKTGKEKKEVKPKILVHSEMAVDVFNVEGKKTGTMELPKEVFGAKINKPLIAQAVRVYLVNQRRGTVSTKTRGEVNYSTRKIYRQKGTGRARHGGRGAPIFVKGGVAHGPQPKDYQQTLPKAMKKAAFTAALSAQKKDNVLTVIAGIESISPKTKTAVRMLEGMGMSSQKRKVLFILPVENTAVQRPLRNVAGVALTTVQWVSTYDILSFRHIILAKEAIDGLVKRVA